MNNWDKQLTKALVFTFTIFGIVAYFALSNILYSVKNDKRILSAIRYEQTFKINKGFYEGCSLTVQERKDYWTFSGYLTKCPSFGDSIIGIESVEVDASDFVQGLQSNRGKGN
jgi:hypothetical protein